MAAAAAAGALVALVGVAAAAQPARLVESTMMMPVAATGPSNLVPTFRWQAGAAEGGAAVSNQASVIQPAFDTMDDSIPDAVFDGAMPDLRDPALPHLIQDGYGQRCRAWCCRSWCPAVQDPNVLRACVACAVLPRAGAPYPRGVSDKHVAATRLCPPHVRACVRACVPTRAPARAHSRALCVARA